MSEMLPILIVGAIIGAFAIVFIMAYIALRKKTKELIEKERNMSDGELIKRLLAYAKPFWKEFVLVLLLMAFSICFDILSPLIIGSIQDMVKTTFVLSDLYKTVVIYGCILLGSQFMKSSFPIDYNMASTEFYVQLIVKSVSIVTMSFIALFIGLAMKSSKATVISSFLLIFLTQANVGDLTLADNAVFPFVLTIISLIFAVLSVAGVEKRDLL